MLDLNPEWKRAACKRMTSWPMARRAVDGDTLYPETLCLAGLLHSLYGTQGFQAFQFPQEKRGQVRGMRA